MAERANGKNEVLTAGSTRTMQEADTPYEPEAEVQSSLKSPSRTLTSARCDFVLASDGRRECAALLLNQFAMKPLQKYWKLTRTKERLREELKGLERQLEDTSQEPSVGQDITQGSPSKASTAKKKGMTQEILCLRQKLEQVEKDIASQSGDLCEQLGPALGRAGFIMQDEAEIEGSTYTFRTDPAHSHFSVPDSRVSERSSQLRRYDANDALEAAEEHLMAMEAQFDSRQNCYYEQRAEWQH